MTIYIVECECIDPFFGPNFVAAFSTEEKAIAYVNSRTDAKDLEISEVELDATENN